VAACRIILLEGKQQPEPIMPHIVEMRTYKLKPGRRSEFLEIFRTKSLPAHAEIGMKIIGPFLSIEDSDTFFFMRAFPDLAAREVMKSRFYDGELWHNELEGMLMPMIDRYDAVLVEDSAGLFGN
jgi:NIPSNAP